MLNASEQLIKVFSPLLGLKSEGLDILHLHWQIMNLSEHLANLQTHAAIKT